MKKKLFAILSVLLILSAVFSIPCSAQANNAVYDNAGIFTDEQKASLNNLANEFFNKNGCSVYIVTAPDTYYEYWGEDFIYENNGVGKNSVILILSCNRTNDYDLYTYGKPARMISNSEARSILDDPEIFNNIKYNDDYYSASQRFIYVSAQACEVNYLGAVLFGVIFALIIAIAVFVTIIILYNKKQRSEKYPLNRYARLELYRTNEFFMGSFITKKYLSSPRGGSGSGGGSGHRGGR